MRLTALSSIDTNHPADGVLYVMFHGYGNNESAMVRIISAVDPDADYMSFRAVTHRPFLGGNFWYDPEATRDQIRLRCSAIGDEIIDQLDATATHQKRIILVGFSQGGYLAYRILEDHADIIDSAILLSPSFYGSAFADSEIVGEIDDEMDEDDDELDDVVIDDDIEEADDEIDGTEVGHAIADIPPHVFLAYGSADNVIPLDQQQGMRDALSDFSDLEDHIYPGLGHTVSVEELDDVRTFIGL